MGRHKEKETAASAGQGERPEQTDADLLTPGSRIPSLQDRERQQLQPRPPSLGYLFTAAHASTHDSPAGIQQTKQQGHTVLRDQPPGSQSRGGQSTNRGSGGGQRKNNYYTANHRFILDTECGAQRTPFCPQNSAWLWRLEPCRSEMLRPRKPGSSTLGESTRGCDRTKDYRGSQAPRSHTQTRLTPQAQGAHSTCLRVSSTTR